MIAGLETGTLKSRFAVKKIEGPGLILIVSVGSEKIS